MEATLARTDLGPSKTTSGDAAATTMRSTTLVVEAMHCGGCIRKVETALRRLPGVDAARANLTTRRVEVRHDSEKADIPRLIDALAAAGFASTELVATAAADTRAVDDDYLKRLAVAGFAAANIMLLSVSVWSGAGGDMPHSLQKLFHWLSAIIAIPAVAYAGQPFFRSAAAALRSRRVNMDVPISLGVLLATGMSIYQTTRNSDQVYFDAAVTLLFFLLVGRALDQRMRVRAKGAAANLLGLHATTATIVLANGATERVSARALAPGMQIITAAGERFAADGRVVTGDSDVDESLITGETRPRQIAAGDLVHAGTLNLGQPVTTTAVATGETTLVAEIARLMTAAEQGRASYVRLADRAARLYAPAVHTLALATFLGWLAVGFGWEPALTAAIAVLIITCPCALALAVPVVQIVATSRLFAQGVLIKSPDALERLADVDAVVLDKTGTITRGEPRLASSAAISDETLAAAARLAASSRHPFARAVASEAQRRGLTVSATSGVNETAGLGLARQTGDGEERLGSARWCGVPDRADVSLWYKPARGAAVPIPLEDDTRTDAAAVVAALQATGWPVKLISGDRPDEARRIAAEVGIVDFAGATNPADKVAALQTLAAAGRKPLMIGDGLNDAPALAAAHASLSPSSAADISKTAADAICQGDRLAPVLETLAVARASERMSIENFGIALAYNIVFVPLAVVGYVTPLLAAVAMSASSIAVVANALRLRNRRLALGTWRSGT